MIKAAKDVNPIMQLKQAYLGIEVAFRWKHNSLKFDQDLLAFFDGGNWLKSKLLLSKAWATEEEPWSNPSLNPKSCRPKPNSDPLVVFTGSTGKEWRMVVPSGTEGANVLLHLSHYIQCLQMNPNLADPSLIRTHLWYPLEAHQMAKNGAQCHQGLGESNHLY